MAKGSTMDNYVLFESETLEFEFLKGKTFFKVEAKDGTVYFHDADGLYVLAHLQSCCENVYLDQIDGDLKDLENREILMADESFNKPDKKRDKYGCIVEAPESETWSFYKLATSKGYVTLTFRGSSNGYYSETVTLYKIPSYENEEEDEELWEGRQTVEKRNHSAVEFMKEFVLTENQKKFVDNFKDEKLWEGRQIVLTENQKKFIKALQN